MLQRKGYFFTLDALIGFSILVMGVVLFMRISVENAESKSFDFVNSVRLFFSEKIDQVDFNEKTPFAVLLKDCFYNGLCELHNQIDQQLLILCQKGESSCDSIAKASLNELSKAAPLGEANLSLSIWCNKVLLYNTTGFNLSREGKNASDIASSKWVVAANEGNELYGPCVFEVISWS